MVLSNECLNLIFDQLNGKTLYQCTLVNRQFHSVANPHLYRSLHIKTSTQFHQLVKGLKMTKPAMGPFVQRLELDAFPGGGDITALSLFDTLVTCFSDIQELSMDVRGLKDLPIPQSGFTMNTFFVACGCGFNLTQLKQLTSLNISGSPPVLTKYIVIMKKTPVNGRRPPMWPKLVSFSIDTCSEIKDIHIKDFVLAHPRLQHLNLKNAKVSDITLRAMEYSMSSSLITLGLPFNSRISANGLRRLVCACPRLMYVDLVGGHGIRSDQFPEVGDHCMNIPNNKARQNRSRRHHSSGTLAYLDQQAIIAIQLTGFLAHDDGDMDDGKTAADDLYYDRDGQVMHVEDGLSFSQHPESWQFFYMGNKMGRMDKYDY